MRNIVVALQLQHLGIDQDQAAFFGREAVEQRQQDAVEADRFTRTGGTRDQQMRHGGKIGDDRFAGDILAQNDRQAALGIGKIGAGGQFLQHDHLAVGIGQFDAHHGLARNGRDARADRAHIAGDIFGQADDAAGLDAGRRFQFVHGDDRAGANGGDLALHVEIVEHGFEQAGVALQRHLVELGRGVLRAARPADRGWAACNRRTCRAALRPSPCWRCLGGALGSVMVGARRGWLDLDHCRLVRPPWPTSCARGASFFGRASASVSSANRCRVARGAATDVRKLRQRQQCAPVDAQRRG